MRFINTDATPRMLWEAIEQAPARNAHLFTAETLRALLAWNDPNGDYRNMPAREARELVEHVALANRTRPANRAR